MKLREYHHQDKKQILIVKDFSKLKRKRYPMSDYIRKALERHKLMGLYSDRPPYQQNDYIGWITRAKLEVTRQKRLEQMIRELRQGNVYMKMKWNSKWK